MAKLVSVLCLACAAPAVSALSLRMDSHESDNSFATSDYCRDESRSVIDMNVVDENQKYLDHRFRREVLVRLYDFASETEAHAGRNRFRDARRQYPLYLPPAAFMVLLTIFYHELEWRTELQQFWMPNLDFLGWSWFIMVRWLYFGHAAKVGYQMRMLKLSRSGYQNGNRNADFSIGDICYEHIFGRNYNSFDALFAPVVSSGIVAAHSVFTNTLRGDCDASIFSQDCDEYDVTFFIILWNWICNGALLVVAKHLFDRALGARFVPTDCYVGLAITTVVCTVLVSADISFVVFVLGMIPIVMASSMHASMTSF